MRSTLSRTVLKGLLNKTKPEEEWRRILTPTQFKVMREGHTEPGRKMKGGFESHFEDSGTYHCAACDSKLYDARMKFHCGCGWPAFHTCLPNSVWELPDADNTGRMEIKCAFCASHLGHVFRGEGFSNPEPNERHCVNSVSLTFQKEGQSILRCSYEGPVH